MKDFKLRALLTAVVAVSFAAISGIWSQLFVEKTWDYGYVFIVSVIITMLLFSIWTWSKFGVKKIRSYRRGAPIQTFRDAWHRIADYWGNEFEEQPVSPFVRAVCWVLISLDTLVLAVVVFYRFVMDVPPWKELPEGVAAIVIIMIVFGYVAVVGRVGFRRKRDGTR